MKRTKRAVKRKNTTMRKKWKMKMRRRTQMIQTSTLVKIKANSR